MRGSGIGEIPGETFARNDADWQYSVICRDLCVLEDDHSAVTVNGLDANAFDVDQLVNVKKGPVCFPVVDDQPGLAKTDALEGFRNFLG